jgi:hypothetical protein
MGTTARYGNPSNAIIEDSLRLRWPIPARNTDADGYKYVLQIQDILSRFL